MSVPALAFDLRKTLENTVVDARDKAERGARDALTALAVGASEPFSSMSDEERRLRNRLRAHGRQLGDQRDPQKGTQSIERLVREMAYEHWHRMLFARFLAENQLLIEPTSGVAISLDECEELAAEEGIDPWELAAQFAQEMLPEIFRLDDPVLAVKLPLEIRQRLESLLSALPQKIFEANDSLGWVYQFWQKTAKQGAGKDVQSGSKIESNQLSSVTQLFTENYMVDFVIDNTVGALFGGEKPRKELEAEEAERQQKDPDFEYLRLTCIPSPTEKSISKIKLLDPCCGSGHFLAAALAPLSSLRAKEESISLKEALERCIRENLYGLEIDERCAQIAAFNIAFSAWRIAGCYFSLSPNIACSGISLAYSLDEWKAALRDGDQGRTVANTAELDYEAERLYDYFSLAPHIGSLVDSSELQRNLFSFANNSHLDAVSYLLEKDSSAPSIPDTGELKAKASLAATLSILSKKYDLICTNVPFLGRRMQGPELTSYADRYYPEAKADLATMFIERCFRLLCEDGILASVMPMAWMNKPGYKKWRKQLLSKRSIHCIVKLGEYAFESSAAAGAFPSILIASKALPFHDSEFIAIDVSSARGEPKINSALKSQLLKRESSNAGQSSIYAYNPDKGNSLRQLQLSCLKNSDSRITFADNDGQSRCLGDFCTALHGQGVGDGAQFNRKFWEVNPLSWRWEYYQLAPSKTCLFGGRDEVVLWEGGAGLMAGLAASVKHLNHKAQQWKSGMPNWGKVGVAVSLVGEKRATLYSGNIYGENCCVIVPNDSKLVPSLWRFAQSGELAERLKDIDSSFAVSVKTLLAVPFEEEEEDSPGLEDPNPLEPYSDQPDQWIFHGHPAACPEEHVLQVAAARVIGFRWPSEYDDSLLLGAKAKELAKRCSLLSHHADDDGIVPLVSIRAEPPAAARIRSLLTDAFQGIWSSQKESECLTAAALQYGTPMRNSIDEWLAKDFFAQHCKLYSSRPFIWHIWDGHPNGFSAFVNYHMIAAPEGKGRKTLERLTYSYLGDWLDRQRLAHSEGDGTAEAKIAAAAVLKSELENILLGEPPYDIFVRWKPLHQLPLGWDPDVGDGVAPAIRPFINASLGKSGVRGAGILRAKPGALNWKKDKGKEAEPWREKSCFPWFWGCDDSIASKKEDYVFAAVADGDNVPFDGIRWNDLHYTRAAKEAARVRQRGEG